MPAFLKRFYERVVANLVFRKKVQVVTATGLDLSAVDVRLS